MDTEQIKRLLATYKAAETEDELAEALLGIRLIAPEALAYLLSENEALRTQLRVAGGASDEVIAGLKARCERLEGLVREAVEGFGWLGHSNEDAARWVERAHKTLEATHA